MAIRHVLLAILSIWSTTQVYGANVDFEYAEVIQNRYVHNTVITDDGYIVLGSFIGNVDFDPGVGVTSLTSRGASDIFIAKISNDHSLQWVTQIGGTGDEIAIGTSNTEVNALRLYQDGSISLAVKFTGTATVGTSGIGPQVTSSGGTDILFAKLTEGGDPVWAKSIGTASDCEQIAGSAIDNSGNLVLTGRFCLTVDFDPGPETANLSGGATNTLRSAFLARYSGADGAYIWAKKFATDATPNNIFPSGLDVDINGNIYVSGECFRGPWSFGESIGANLLGCETRGVFLARYGSDGVNAWAAEIVPDLEFPSTGSGQSVGPVAVDSANGRVVVAGEYAGRGDFDPSAGTYFEQSSDGGAGTFPSDPFFWILSLSGGFIHANILDSMSQFNGAEEITSVSIDDGKFFAVGRTITQFDFDPGAQVATFTPQGIDGFLLEMSTDGIFVSLQRFGEESGTLSELILSCSVRSGRAIVGGFANATGQRSFFPNASPLIVDASSDFFLAIGSRNIVFSNGFE